MFWPTFHGFPVEFELLFSCIHNDCEFETEFTHFCMSLSLLFRDFSFCSWIFLGVIFFILKLTFSFIFMHFGVASHCIYWEKLIFFLQFLLFSLCILQSELSCNSAFIFRLIQQQVYRFKLCYCRRFLNFQYFRIFLLDFKHRFCEKFDRRITMFQF